MCLSLKALLLNLLVLPLLFSTGSTFVPLFFQVISETFRNHWCLFKHQASRQTQKSQNAVVNAKMLICNSKWCHKFCLERPTQCFKIFLKSPILGHLGQLWVKGPKNSPKVPLKPYKVFWVILRYFKFKEYFRLFWGILRKV